MAAMKAFAEQNHSQEREHVLFPFPHCTLFTAFSLSHRDMRFSAKADWDNKLWQEIADSPVNPSQILRVSIFLQFCFGGSNKSRKKGF